MYFEEVFNLCSTGAIVLNPQDMEWFITMCWNYGVFFGRLEVYDESEKFLSLALKLLPFSVSLMNAFSQDLDSSYSSLLSIMKRKRAEQEQEEQEEKIEFTISAQSRMIVE